MAISINCPTVDGCSSAANAVPIGVNQTESNANVMARQKGTLPSCISSRLPD